jgi:hypothetical protein
VSVGWPQSINAAIRRAGNDRGRRFADKRLIICGSWSFLSFSLSRTI